MRVLTIINGFDTGGIEKTLLGCLPGFKAEGVVVDLCCYKDAGPLRAEYLEHISTVHIIKKTGSMIADAVQLSRILRKNSYDLVHSRFGYSSGGFALAARMQGIPVAVSIHSSSTSLFSHNTGIFWDIIRKLHSSLHIWFTKRLADVVIGHSKANLCVYDSQWEKKKLYRLVYNGVDFGKINCGPDDFIFDKAYNHILHTGSMRYQKNHMYLLEVFKNILKTRPQTKLILLGDGPLRGEIEQAIEKKGLRDKVILRGLKGNVGYYYKNSDLFLFPSLMEGFGNVLIEAQYFSLPVLASGIAPHREAVHTGQHDHLFDLSTSPEEVAVMANAIMDDPDKGYVKEAKEFADGFSIGEMVINLKNIYRGMVDGKETDR